VFAGEFGGQALKPVRPAGHQHEVRAAAGQLAGEFGAEAGAGAGDDDGLAVVVDFAHAIHSTPLGALRANDCIV
jgi:hypothetical protein